MSTGSSWAEHAAGPPRVESELAPRQGWLSDGPPPPGQTPVGDDVSAVPGGAARQRTGVSPWWALIPLGMALIGVIAAFGSGHRPSSQPTATPRPTHGETLSEYHAAVNAMCRDLRFDLASLPPATSAAAVRTDLIRTRSVAARFVARIATLPAPPELGATAPEAVDASRYQLAQLDSLIADMTAIARSGASPQDPSVRGRLDADLAQARFAAVSAHQVWLRTGATECAEG